MQRQKRRTSDVSSNMTACPEDLAITQTPPGVLTMHAIGSWLPLNGVSIAMESGRRRWKTLRPRSQCRDPTSIATS
jgi:hypothetical protein